MSIKPKSVSQGFTLVELLIVIVVIAILAAITIVSYGNVTKKANDTAAAQNAGSVRSAAETYNVDPATTAGYPADAATFRTYVTSSSSTAKLNGVTISNNTTTSPNVQLSGSNGTVAVIYAAKSGTPTPGACIGYWDYDNAVVAWSYVGTATAGVVNGGATAATCS